MNEFAVIWFLLGEDARNRVDLLGEEFYTACGYDVKKAVKYPNERKKLRRKMKKNREEIKVVYHRDGEGSVFIRFVLYKFGKAVKASREAVFLVGEGRSVRDEQ